MQTQTVLAKIFSSSNAAILTLNLFYFDFSAVCVRDDFAFCSLIMLVIEVIYADK